MAAERSVKAYFRGNGTNVIKNVPETALKLTLNDRVKALVLRDGHQMALCECGWLTGLVGAASHLTALVGQKPACNLFLAGTTACALVSALGQPCNSVMWGGTAMRLSSVRRQEAGLSS